MYLNFWVIFLCIFCFTKSEGLILDSIKGWLFGPEADIEKALAKNVKFEVVSTDKKFLKFASELSELSPLDSCYHIVSILLLHSNVFFLNMM